MITFYAAQHFFSSVPADQSPTRKRGYQTLFRTPALPPEVVRQIEDRCLYAGKETDPPKWQYYPLGNNLFAVSQTVALAERDEFGRKGRYLAHTLVFDQGALRQLEGCPIDILSQFAFLIKLEDVFAQSKPGSQDMRAIPIQISPVWRSLAQSARASWRGEQLIQLGRLAWQAARLKEERVSTALNGSIPEVLECLALVFALAGPQHRPLLSFDTWAQDCDWGPGVYFWLQRFAPGEKGRLAQSVDANARTLSNLTGSAEASPFGRWLETELPRLNLVNASPQEQWAAELEQVLAGQSVGRESTAVAPDAFIQRFAQINPQAVARAWAAYLPDGLSAELKARFQAAVAADPAPYLNILASGLAQPDLNTFLFQQLYTLGAAPARADRTLLEKYIQKSGDGSLASLPPLWAKKAKEWGAALELLDEFDYRYALSSFLRWPELPLDIWAALDRPHLEIWLNVAVLSIQAEQWKDVLEVLDELGEPALERLAAYARHLRPEAAAQISRWLEKYKGDAPQLRSAFPPGDRKKFLGLF